MGAGQEALSGEAEALSGGGGLALGWLFLDFASLNEQLAAAELPQLQPGPPFLVLGGGGLGAHQRGWSLGGFLLYGERGSAWLERAVSFSLGLAGLLLEYGELANKTKKVGLFLGGLFGLGQERLEIFLYPARDFEGALREPHGTSLSRSFTAVGLYTGGELALPGLRLHLMAGYLWTVGVENWRTGASGREFPGPMVSFSAPLLQAIFWFEP